MPTALPYADSKPVCAADFYFVNNATFRFVLQRFGQDGLRQFWTDLGTRYFEPVSADWRSGGFPAVATYWRAFFDAEPGSNVEVSEEPGSVQLRIKICPAITHLRKHNREIVPCFCQHCYFVSEAIAGAAGLTVRVEGGNGECTQSFCRPAADLPPQNLAAILEAKC